MFEESNSLKTISLSDKVVPFELLIDKPEASKLSEHIESSNKEISFIFLTK